MTIAPKSTADRSGRFAGLAGLLVKLNSEISGAEQGGRPTLLSKGDLAELRRLDPGDLTPTCWPFWRLALAVIEPAGLIDVEAARDLTTWATLLRASAELGNLERPSSGSLDLRLGAALALAGVKEQRLLQLLRADFERLPDLIRSITRQLKSQGQSVDLFDLARLLLSAGHADAETVRRQIAIDYFRALDVKNKKGAASAA